MAGFQVDRYIGIRCYIPVPAWLSGRPDHAAAVARDALEAAEGLGHLASQSNVLAVAACPVALWNGDLDTLERCTNRLRSILDKETIGLWVPKDLRTASRLLQARRGTRCVRQGVPFQLLPSFAGEVSPSYGDGGVMSLIAGSAALQWRSWDV